MLKGCKPLFASALCLLAFAPMHAEAQLSKVKTVWVVLMENHNWTGNNSGAKFGAPDLKGNALAPYINGPLLSRSAHAEQYFNPPGNHPSQPNYIWLEAGTNFGVLADTQPGDPQLTTSKHFVSLLEKAGLSWRAYAEPVSEARFLTAVRSISAISTSNTLPSSISRTSTRTSIRRRRNASTT